MRMTMQKLRAFLLAVSVAWLIAAPADATEVLKVLGQLNPSATTLTTLYTVPSATSTVVSTVMVTNQAASNATFRVTVQPACATVDPKHYLAYDVTVPANDAIVMTLGVTLATTDCIRVYASTTTLSFNAFGAEVQ